jgi:hypothetical protein
MVDDRSQYPSCIVNKLDIGLAGIELALAGGFDKVTWDGSANNFLVSAY